MGKYHCPGRWLAVAEMQLFVLMFLNMLEFTPLSASVPKPCVQRIMNTQEPGDDFWVEFKRV